jgi:hypothetical protein
MARGPGDHTDGFALFVGGLQRDVVTSIHLVFQNSERRNQRIIQNFSDVSARLPVRGADIACILLARGRQRLHDAAIERRGPTAQYEVLRGSFFHLILHC